MALVKIENKNDFEQLIDSKNRFLFLKNSLTCPISRKAFEAYESFSNQEEGEFYFLNVQESRDLSNFIADTYGVKHESPQVLLFEDNQIVFNDSHWAITPSLLEEKWASK